MCDRVETGWVSSRWHLFQFCSRVKRQPPLGSVQRPPALKCPAWRACRLVAAYTTSGGQLVRLQITIVSASRTDNRMRVLATLSCLTLAAVASTASAQHAPATISLLRHRPITIGSVEGPPETLFAGIVGVVRLPSGLIVVGDGGNQVIRFFSGAGKHVRSAGRQGRGPGEFMNLRWLGACPNDELLAVDPALGRFSVISATDGRLLRTVPMQTWLRGNQLLSCGAGQQMVALLDQPREIGEKGKVMRAPAALVRFRLDSESSDTLVRVPGTDYYFALRVPGFSALPLGGHAYAASGGGTIYVAQNNESRIQVINAATGQLRAIEHGLRRRRLTAAAWREAKLEMVEQFPLGRTRKLVADVLAEAPVPATQPAFLDLKADRVGRVWLRVPSSTSLTTWRVLDAHGRHLASVTMPSRVEPLDISEQHVVGIARDSLGVQTVVVYTFPRPFIPVVN